METPKNWNDSSQWDRYFQSRPVDLATVSDLELKDNMRVLFAASGGSIWITGCGQELSPWLLSYLNCRVLATDLSPVAVEQQKEWAKGSPFLAFPNLDQVVDGFAAEMNSRAVKQFIPPKIEVADFCQGHPDRQFDVLYNRRAFHGLSPDQMDQAAQNFFAATKPGGLAYLSTLNVQGQLRTQIENALSQAGFFMPNLEAEQWYREKLDATGIEYVMVLGNPVIPQWGQYEGKGGEPQRRKDFATLGSLREEYRERLQANYQKDQETFRPDVDKLAYVIYNTG